MKKKTALATFILSLSLFFTVLFTTDVQAQCPMCKANVESALKNDGKRAGLGLNGGITMLLAMPYLAFGIIGIIWYRSSRKNKAAKAVTTPQV